MFWKKIRVIFYNLVVYSFFSLSAFYSLDDNIGLPAMLALPSLDYSDPIVDNDGELNINDDCTGDEQNENIQNMADRSALFCSNIDPLQGLRLSNTEKRFLCQFCMFVAKDKWQLKTHIQMSHAKRCIFKCKVCHRGFEKKTNLKIHEKDQCFVCCDICKKRFEGQSKLRVHYQETHLQIRSVRNMRKPYGCEICKKHFSCEQQLSMHRQNVH